MIKKACAYSNLCLFGPESLWFPRIYDLEDTDSFRFYLSVLSSKGMLLSVIQYFTSYPHILWICFVTFGHTNLVLLPTLWETCHSEIYWWNAVSPLSKNASDGRVSLSLPLAGSCHLSLFIFQHVFPTSIHPINSVRPFIFSNKSYLLPAKGSKVCLFFL